MTSALVLAIVFALMLVESRLSRAHEGALRRQGAVEPPDDVYPWMQVLYPLAFLAPAVEGWVRAARIAPFWWFAGLALFAAAKALKYWAVYTLGERWTFKVLVPPGSQRTRRGPYRVCSHPNYIAVAGEILGAALLLGGPWSGIVFTLLFAMLMLRRVSVEERALS